MALLCWFIIIGLARLCCGFGIDSCSEFFDKTNMTECNCDESDRYSNLTCPIDKERTFDILFRNNLFEIDCKNQFIENMTLIPRLVSNHVDFVEFFGFINCSMTQSVNISNKLILTKHINKMALKKIDSMITPFLPGYHINRLYIQESQLDTLPEDLLYEIEDLEAVFINNNNFTSLPENFFKNSRKLSGIDLGENKLRTIPTKLFANTHNLNSLHLFGNDLTSINSSLFIGLNNLIELELMANLLEDLPADAFINLPQLKYLSLRKNKFKTFAVGLFNNNKQLNTLQFSNNELLTSLPDEFFANLTDLENVYLDNCNLNDIPENVFWGAVKISTLRLDFNKLTYLKKDLLKDTTNLQELHLEYNELEKLDEGIFRYVKNLKKLHLGNNKLKILDNTFSGLKNLQMLDLQHNSLHNLRKNSFKHFENLLILDMSFNNLTLENIFFQDQVYSILPLLNKLESLYLQNNKIRYVFSDWVFTLPSLQELNLEYNSISSLDFSMLQFVAKHSITVNLQHNKIHTIDLSTAESIVAANKELSTEKRIIYLDGNPINCDCRIYDLVRYIDGSMNKDVRDRFLLHLEEIKCQSSKRYIGMSLTELKSELLTCVLDDGPKLPPQCAENMRQHYEYRRHDNMLIMDCSYKKLTKIPALVQFNRNSKYKNLTIEILLSGNNIKSLSKPDEIYDNVVELDLSHNNINEVLWIPPRIQVLKLHNNNLTYLSSEELSNIDRTSLRNLTFHNNPWQCDCNLINFTKYLQENFKKVSNLRDITCDKDMRELTHLSLDDLCPNILQLVAVICGILAFFGLMVAICVALYFRYTQQIKVWLYAHNLCLYFITEDELDQDKIYDAFVSFSHEDEDFVVNELLPKLEQGPHPFRICVHYRDFQPGEFITTNIARAIDDSRRTIVVLSRGFLRSEWGRMEFRTAHTEAMREGRARVVVIVYGDIGPISDLDEELRAYLSTNTYIKWGTPWFWDNLRYALPHSSNLSAKQLDKSQQDKIDLIKEPATPPATTTPPVDTARHFNGPLIHSALNVTLIDGTLVNSATKKEQSNTDINHLSLVV